jgi:hypothetical protein
VLVDGAPAGPIARFCQRAKPVGGASRGVAAGAKATVSTSGTDPVVTEHEAGAPVGFRLQVTC